MKKKGLLMKGLNFLAVIVVMLLGFALSLSLQGCRKSTPPLETKRPIELDFGKQGIAPTKVYQDYDWLIISRQHYEGTCK